MINTGKHRGRIVVAELRKSTKDDGKSPYAFLEFQVGTETVGWIGSFSETVIQQGNNAGKRVGEMTVKQLVALGWQGDFTSFAELLDVETDVTVAHETDDQGRVSARVKFIGSGGGKPAETGDIAGLKNSFRAAVLEAKKGAPKPPPKAPAKPASGGGGYDDIDYGGGRADDGLPF